MRRRRWVGSHGAVLLVLAAGALLAAGAASAAEGGKQKGGEAAEEAAVGNIQQRIQTTDKGIEIELRSATPFPVRALPPVLRIGKQEFWQSRNPADGRLDTLIFLVPREAFDKLGAEDPVTVFYALGMTAGAEEGTPAAAVPERAGRVWRFGTFKKEMLDREPGPEPEAEAEAEE